MQSNSKILIIQTAFIGDVILSTPLVEKVHEVLAPKRLDFLTIPNSVNVVESNPHITDVIVFDKAGKEKGLRGLRHMAKQLAAKNYNFCLTPHRSWRSAFLTKATGAKTRIGFDRTACPNAYTHLISYQSQKHEIERNLSLLEPFDTSIEISKPKIYSTSEDIEEVQKLLVKMGIFNNENLFAVAPGSIWPTKKWPLDYFRIYCQLQTKKGKCIILIGSKDDITICQKIETVCENCISLAGKMTIRQTHYLLGLCKGLLTNDSAPMHLGLSVNIPVYAIFGPTHPRFGFAPFGEQDHVFEKSNLACRPCGIHGGKRCPTRTFACMESMFPKIVDAYVSTTVR
jgi:heptosyltransferase-2